MKRIILLGLAITYLQTAFSDESVDIGPLISGTSSYVAGSWAWTDYAYDDRGTDSDATAGGDAQYPEGTTNAADIIQLQVSLQATSVRFTAVLQTLTDESVPEIGLMLDTDSSASTGSSGVPGSEWPVQGSMGGEWLLSISNAGAAVHRWDGAAFELVAELPAVIDVERNTVSFDLPKSTLDPGSSHWRLYAWAGLASMPTAAGGEIFDLAFVVGELITDRNSMVVDSVQGAFVTGGTTLWQDQNQSAILAGKMDVSLASASIDFARLNNKDTELATADGPGWYTFLHHSDLKLAEGVEQGSSLIGVGNAFTTRRYLGPYQPYLVLNRAGEGDKHPMVVFLHGASQTHVQNTYWFDPAEANNTFDYQAITIFPLARGEVLSYNGIAEYDVLEVMQDAFERLPVDRDRVVLTGFSMGGMGTYKLASLYPDMFSTAVAHFGNAQSNGVTGLMENLVNLPFRADNGMIDYLVQPTSFLPDRERGIELGYDFRFFDVTNAHHALQPHLANCLLVNAIKRARAKNPAKVVYAIESDRFIDEPETGLRLVYDGAYWLSKVALRDGTEEGVVRVVSLARADRKTVIDTVDEYHESVMRDYCGAREDNMPSPAAGFHWRERSLIHRPGPLQPVSNGMTINLNGIKVLTLDLARMSLDTSTPLTLEIEGDGQTTLTLLGDWEGLYRFSKDGVEQRGYMPDVNGDLVLVEDFTGLHRFVIARSEQSGDDPVDDPPPPPPVSPPEPDPEPEPRSAKASSSGGGAFSPMAILVLIGLGLAGQLRSREN